MRRHTNRFYPAREPTVVDCQDASGQLLGRRTEQAQRTERRGCQAAVARREQGLVLRSAFAPRVHEADEAHEDEAVRLSALPSFGDWNVANAELDRDEVTLLVLGEHDARQVDNARAPRAEVPLEHQATGEGREG